MRCAGETKCEEGLKNINETLVEISEMRRMSGRQSGRSKLK
jgi:hypothetical protein